MAKSLNKEKINSFLTLSRSQQIMLGVFLILLSILVFSSLLSYFSTWRADQSEIESFFDKNAETLNVAKKFGALVSHFLIYKMFGVASFIISILLFITGLSYFVGANSKNLLNKWTWGLLITIWFSLFFGYFFTNQILAGAIGFEMTDFISIYTGDIGVLSILIFGFISFVVIRIKITPEIIYDSIKKYLVSKKIKTSEFQEDDKK